MGGEVADPAMEAKIRKRMAQLLACNGDYGQVDAAQLTARLAWWSANKDRLKRSGSLCEDL